MKRSGLLSRQELLEVIDAFGYDDNGLDVALVLAGFKPGASVGYEIEEVLGFEGMGDIVRKYDKTGNLVVWDRGEFIVAERSIVRALARELASEGGTALPGSDEEKLPVLARSDLSWKLYGYFCEGGHHCGKLSEEDVFFSLCFDFVGLDGERHRFDQAYGWACPVASVPRTISGALRMERRVQKYMEELGLTDLDQQLGHLGLQIVAV